MYFWCTYKYFLFYNEKPQIYVFKISCNFNLKHKCLLWHLYTGCWICIYNLLVVFELNCICFWEFWDSPDVNQFFQQETVCGQSDVPLLVRHSQERTSHSPLFGLAAYVSIVFFKWPEVQQGHCSEFGSFIAMPSWPFYSLTKLDQEWSLWKGSSQETFFFRKVNKVESLRYA